MEKIKLLESEVDKLKSLRAKGDSIIVDMGRIELEITLLEEQKTKLKSDFIQLQKDQQTLGSELQVKYGDGEIRLDTGEFIKAG